VVQREDDRPETVESRIATYHAQTAPVLAWARELVRVVDIDADRPIDEVRQAVLSALV
jgi:adenylate kinase